MKKAMTKATDISREVKQAVAERDGGICIIPGCGCAGTPNAHYIPRSQGGLGIEENIVTLCPACHHDYDHTGMRRHHGQIIKIYLDGFYPGFPDEDRIYHRYPKELRV